MLLADQGRNHQEVARELQISRDMASLWRECWLALSPKDVAVAERLQNGVGTLIAGLQTLLRMRCFNRYGSIPRPLGRMWYSSPNGRC